MSAWFAMGGYGGFIWSAYAVAFAALGGLIVLSLSARRRVRRELSARGLDKRR
jgi:heme exporter protein D